MRIGFDAKKAVKNLTGIGNYSRRCINATARDGSGNEVFLFAPRKHNDRAASQLHGRFRYVSPGGMAGNGLLFELWRDFTSWRTARRLGLDIFHGVSNELPFGITRSGCRTVVTIHDLIFLRHPETYSWDKRIILKLKTRYACRVADRIIAISKKTRDDITGFYGTPEDKITIVYQSIAPKFFEPVDKAETAATLRRLGITRRFILCVGTVERRKNQEVLLRALPQINPDTDVVIAGKPTKYQSVLRSIVRSNGTEGRVLFLNNTTNDELRHLYHGAEMTVLMSLFEGFGLPIAESLACGTPVIAAQGSCLEEAGGPGAVYLRNDDTDGLVLTANRILADHNYRQSLAEAGRDYVERFRDERMEEGLAEVYNQLSDNRKQ